MNRTHNSRREGEFSFLLGASLEIKTVSEASSLVLSTQQFGAPGK